MDVRVFVAGGTGVVGRRLVPQLVAQGHQVTATTTSPGKLKMLAQLGAEGVVTGSTRSRCERPSRRPTPTPSST
jgi:nucleoside-diphosphate-sugar epimerase